MKSFAGAGVSAIAGRTIATARLPARTQRRMPINETDARPDASNSVEVLRIAPGLGADEGMEEDAGDLLAGAVAEADGDRVLGAGGRAGHLALGQGRDRAAG